MFQNDQMVSGEIGLVILTLTPIFAVALVIFTLFFRREDRAVTRDPTTNPPRDGQ